MNGIEHIDTDKPRIIACPRDCYDTCIFELKYKNKEILFEPSPFPYGVKVMCPRAYKDVERTFSNKRILYPHKALDKRKNEFTRITWREALDLIAKRIKHVLNQYGPEKILVLDYAGNMGLITRHFSQRLWYLLRAARTDYSICDGAGELGIILHYGKTYGALPESMDQSKLIVYWGFNPAVTSIHSYHKAYQLKKKKGLKIIVVDPIKTETSKVADLWLRPKFGTDIYLALGLANYIINNDYYDHDFIEKYTYGFDEFSKWVSRFDLDIVSRKTGIIKEDIIEFAEMYIKLKPNLIFIGYGLQRRRGGTNTVRAISLLPALIGEHRGFYYSNSDGLILDRNVFRGVYLGKPSKIIPQSMISEYLESEEFKFIYVQLVNPIGTHPNSEKIKEYFLRNDVFVVVNETHWSDTARFADIVVPAQTYLEKDDFIIGYWHNYLVMNKRIIKPLGDSWSEVKFQRQLARRLGINHPDIFSDPVDVLKRFIGEHKFKELLEKGFVQLEYLNLDTYQTPSGKIEFKSQRAKEMKLSEFPEPIELDPLGDNQFYLVFKPSFKHTHTQFEEIYGDPPNLIYINEKDAQDLGIRGGDRVIVGNDLGELILLAAPSDIVPRKILLTYKSAKSINGKRISSIVKPVMTRYRESEINGTIVYVKKIT